MIVFGQNGCVRAMWLCSGNVVVFGQKLLFSDNLVVFGQNVLYSVKVDVFGQK